MLYVSCASQVRLDTRFNGIDAENWFVKDNPDPLLAKIGTSDDLVSKLCCELEGWDSIKEELQKDLDAKYAVARSAFLVATDVTPTKKLRDPSNVLPPN